MQIKDAVGRWYGLRVTVRVYIKTKEYIYVYTAGQSVSPNTSNICCILWALLEGDVTSYHSQPISYQRFYVTYLYFFLLC